MTEKPPTARGCHREHLALVRATCLFFATKLGDLMDDLVVVGGLVPSLLIDEDAGNTAFEPHVGTMDLDIGLLQGENKDAYDLFYVLRDYGASLEDVVRHMRPLLEGENTTKAIEILRRDFLRENGVGRRRVAEFRAGGPDEAIQADVVGFVGDLLRRLEASESTSPAARNLGGSQSPVDLCTGWSTKLLASLLFHAGFCSSSVPPTEGLREAPTPESANLASWSANQR
jgi:hypothetical protein